MPDSISVGGPINVAEMVNAVGCNAYTDDRRAYRSEVKSNGKPNQDVIL